MRKELQRVDLILMFNRFAVFYMPNIDGAHFNGVVCRQVAHKVASVRPSVGEAPDDPIA